MIAATLFFAAELAQAPNAPGDCAVAMARGTSAATAQICLAETVLDRAHTQPKESTEWKRQMDTAVALYKKAFALPADDEIKAVTIERLLSLFDAPVLNNASEMFAAFRDLITLRPHESAPLLRLAQYQESRGAVDAAEETLLAARRLQPTPAIRYRGVSTRRARGRHRRRGRGRNSRQRIGHRRRCPCVEVDSAARRGGAESRARVAL